MLRKFAAAVISMPSANIVNIRAQPFRGRAGANVAAPLATGSRLRVRAVSATFVTFGGGASHVELDLLKGAATHSNGTRP